MFLETEEQISLGTTMRSDSRLVVEEKEEEEEVMVCCRGGVLRWWTVMMVPMRPGDVLSIDL